MKQIKIIVEKHSDGYVAYPLGIKGAIVCQGDTYEEAVADIKSAIRCYIEVFGKEMLENESPVIEAFVTYSTHSPSGECGLLNDSSMRTLIEL
ncbi:type II toxin-antitoxin system HicB family antitoxin [Cylindrospermum sp. FACHB-282]|uniref:type II toxin-antitoxin system HicB family antitoxin n=1 Tax=Cylindrospermum sp. FACHB-282 TaxID=2692794 RepID=UPI001F5583CF|nr:hypothetical protein [Cylindrospermum sp. FACHB-282]